MRCAHFVGALASCLLACISSDDTQVLPDGGDAGDATLTDGPATQPPTHAPSSVTLRDGDVTQGSVDGSITIGKASNESDVTSYVLYWGADATTKLNGQNAIATVTATGGNLDVPIKTQVPLGATKILAFSANAAGEMATGPSTDADNYTRYADVSAGAAGYQVSAAIDSAGGKLLLTTCPQLNTVGPWLVQCNLDGTGCNSTDISGGTNHTWGPVRIAVDAASSKVVVTGANGTTNSGPQVYRCNLDGTGCTFVDLSSVQNSDQPVPVIDAANGKLLVVATTSSMRQLGLYRCNLDGSSCTFTNLGAQVGKGTQSGNNPAPAIDTTNQKLLVAVSDSSGTPNEPSLYVCNLDGTGCAVKDISVGQGQNSGMSPSLAIDPTGHVTTATDGPKGFHCALDGTGCAYHDLSSGHAATHSSVAVDAAASKLYVAANDGSTKLALYRCELDGSACAFVDMSAGHPNGSGAFPSIVLDTAGQRILVATSDGSNGNKPALFTLGLW